MNRKKIFSTLGQISIFIIIFIAITVWQGRNMLESNSPAPLFQLESIKGKTYNLSDSKGKRVVLYFFSPWCSICKISSHNINAIRKSLKNSDTEIYAIALSWKDKNDIIKFAANHNLTVPVLYGNNEVSHNYKISSFPSIYILNKKGEISHKAIGYTTEIGLRTRLFFTN